MIVPINAAADAAAFLNTHWWKEVFAMLIMVTIADGLAPATGARSSQPGAPTPGAH